MSPRLLHCAPALVLILAPIASGQGQSKPSDTRAAVVRVLDVGSATGVLISPDRGKALILEPMTGASETPELRLAGERINPATSARPEFTVYSALIVQPIGRGDIRRVVVPYQARITNPIWSPDAKWVAYMQLESAGISLWIADASNGESHMVLGPVLNGAFGNPCQWLPDSSGMVCARVPNGRGAAPQAPPRRPGMDLLESASDEALFEHYFTDQLIVVPLAGGERTVGQPGIHGDVQISPDGKYLLVETIHRPFSPKVTSARFPTYTQVWDIISGSSLRTLADRELREKDLEVHDAVISGPRMISWRSDAPASLAWAEALDGGYSPEPMKLRDRVMLLDAPFTGNPAKLADVEFRVRSITWARPTLALVTEGWEATSRTRTWVVNPAKPTVPARILFDRRATDKNPVTGTFVMKAGANGAPVLMTSKDGRFAFLMGATGDRPFVDRMDLVTGRSVRWVNPVPASQESAVAVINPDLGQLMMKKQGGNQLPSYYVKAVKR